MKPCVTEFSILKEIKDIPENDARGNASFLSSGERVGVRASISTNFELRQFKKLEQDLRPRAEAPRGEIKSKHAMHLMRLLLSGISALREGELRVRLDEERDALLTIKRGERPWPDVNAWRLRLHKEFDEAFASTQLPERPDYAWANEFLLKARREMVK